MGESLEILEVPKDPETIRQDEAFERSLLRYGNRKWFLVVLFTMCSTPGIFNGFHIMWYVFASDAPPHWCTIPALRNTSWTNQQIRNISSPSPQDLENCEYYDRDYAALANMDYQSAMQSIGSQSPPAIVTCAEFTYEMMDEEEGTTFVPEWDLVCSRLAEKATIQSIIGIGKLVGAFSFGFTSDRLGRKVSFSIASIMCIVAGPIAAITSKLYILVLARLFLGIASLGLYESAYSMLAETSPAHLRATLAILYNLSYPLGMVGIAILAYFIKKWRTLQQAISLPALLLIINILILHESPRWLYYTGRKDRAWKIIEKYVLPEDKRYIGGGKPIKKKINVRKAYKHMKIFFKKEFRGRLIICWSLFCFSSMSYYALGINHDYFTSYPHLYVAMSGVFEGFSYFIAVYLLATFGRRTGGSMLFFIGAALLFLLIGVPAHYDIGKLLGALLCRLCVSAVFSIIIVHVCELFPTTVRNSSTGTSSTWAHIGSAFAPYIVDVLVTYGAWLASFICGTALLVGGILCQLLPETKGKPLYNTIPEFFERVRANPLEQVSYKNSTIYYLYKKLIDFWKKTQQ